MATGEKAAGTARRPARKKFKSGRSAPDQPQLQDQIQKLKDRFPKAVFERTPQEDGSVVVALTDTRTDPPRAFAIGEGKDTAAALADLKKNLPVGGK